MHFKFIMMFKNKKQNKKISTLFKESESGVSLIFTLLILGIILATCLGVVNLMLKEIKISSNIGYSVTAYYAAEAGIEKTLYNARKGSGPVESCETLSIDPTCTFLVRIAQIGIPPDIPYIIKSVGNFKKTRRGVEVQY